MANIGGWKKNIWEQGVIQQQIDRAWFVVRTGIRAEDKAATHLRRVGFRVYIPKCRRSIMHHRSKKWIVRHFTLFNRYVFVGVDREHLDFETIRQCDGVASILGINGNPYCLPRADITNMMRAQRSGEFDDTRLSDAMAARRLRAEIRRRFVPGYRVQVLRGPFAGFAGQVEGVTAQGMIRAAISLFGRLTPTEFEVGDIEVVT